MQAWELLVGSSPRQPVHFPIWIFPFSSPAFAWTSVQEIEQNNSLEHLLLSCTNMSDDDLASLFRLLPKCPRLATIDAGNNHISSLTLLAMNEESSRLRKSILDWNPILKNANGDDRHTMLRLLGAHPELGYLGDKWNSESSLYTPEIGHLLDLNRSGRVLLTNTNIPLSVWARVFERTNILFKDDPSRQASVIYRFLKEGRSLNFKGPNHWSIWSPGYAAIRHRSGFPSHQAVLKSSLAISNFTYCVATQ